MNREGTPPTPPEIEIAHVLFMDIVRYSLLSLDEQTRLVRTLQEIVRGTREFVRADARSELIRLPAGDGLALAFLRDPIAPVRCAVEIARAARDVPALELRMGVHSGPVRRGEDINAAQNVAGGGVNLARRVMDCGDAGHILVSQSVAEILSQLEEWADRLHDLGHFEVKHGVRLHLYSISDGDVGNLSPPLAPGSRLPAPGPGPAHASDHELPPSPAGSGEPAAGCRQPRVTILYRRDVQPDEEVLKLLERQFRADGLSVFIDRHLKVGMKWAVEIEREIRSADAVVALLSAASVQSEMLQYELQIAHDAAQEGGKPRILPIRIQDTGPLPAPLEGILHAVEYLLWRGPQDDDRLVSELIQTLHHPPEPAVAVAAGRLEPVGGAVPLDSEFYVVRVTDEEFREAIARRDSIVLVKGARQMGKTSLLARGVQQAREAGARVVLTDFQKLNAAHLASAEALFQALAGAIADQLDLDVTPEEVWNPRRGANPNFERFLRREVLGAMTEPIVWGLDEVDRLFTCDFGSEVFGLIRSWHNERALDPGGVWSRLTMAIAYATEAHLFINDLNQSPFNVGTRLVLEDFTFEQVADLNRRYGSPLREGAEVARFHRLVGGHPYLVRRGLHEMVTHGIPLATFERQADRDEGIFGDHLRRILVLLAKDPELSEVVRDLLRGRPCATPEAFYRLRSAGVICGESTRDARPRCQVYATYLERHLL